MDYNPDREGHVKKSWMVVKAIKDPEFKSIKIDGKEFKFGRNGAFRVRDGMLAEAIRQNVGGDATVTRFRTPDPVSDQGHRYFFGSFMGVPWAKYDEFGRRIYDEVKDATEKGTEQESNQPEHSGAGEIGQTGQASGGDSV